MIPADCNWLQIDSIYHSELLDLLFALLCRVIILIEYLMKKNGISVGFISIVITFGAFFLSWKSSKSLCLMSHWSHWIIKNHVWMFYEILWDVYHPDVTHQFSTEVKHGQWFEFRSRSVYLSFEQFCKESKEIIVTWFSCTLDSKYEP